MIRIRKGMLFLMLLLGLTACSQVERQTLDLVTQQPNADTRFVLTILHNNDGESQLIDVGPGLTDYGGAARFATLLDDLRWEALHGPRQVGQTGAKRGVITVSSGDNFLAGPEFDASLEHGVPFYDTIALDLMEYDAMALGNHDFDFGPDVLADFIDGFAHSQPTFVSANLRFDLEPRLGRLVDAGRIARSVVIRERGERVGIVGATTPNLRFISSPRNVEVLADVAAAIQTEVDQLTSRGIDKIVLISHLQDIEGDLALAAELEDVDVMVAGGGDELLANDGDLLVPGDTTYGPYPLFATDGRGVRVPVVTTRGSYAYVGRLVVGFDRDGAVTEVFGNSGPVRVAGADAPDAVVPDPDVQTQAVDPVVEALDELANTELGLSEVDLDGRRSQVRSIETNEGNLIADALLWQARRSAVDFGVADADVALQNGGGIRNDSLLPAGPISELDTYTMVPFPNFVTVFESLPRQTFKDVLENAVSRTPPTTLPGGTGRFAQIAGFSFTYDPSFTPMEIDLDGTIVTPGQRIRDVVLDDGTVVIAAGAVQAGPGVNVATIDFLARGGDQYPFQGAPFTILGTTYQQALADFLVDGLGGVIPAADYPEGGEGRIVELP